MSAAMPLTEYISQQSTRKRQYRTLRASFNNGYEQTAPDGINNVRDIWTVVYSNLTLTDRNSVVSALDTVKGWDYLTWQAPGDDASKKWKVTPDGWSETNNGATWSITFTVEQVY